MAAHQLATRTAPEPEFVLRGHSHAVTALRFLDRDSAKLLASGDVGGYVQLWNLATRRPVATWAAAPLGVLEVHAHDDGKLLTQTRDGRLRIWDLANLDEPTTTLNTNSFFFARCATVGHNIDHRPAPRPAPDEVEAPARTTAARGIGAAPASEDDDGTAPPAAAPTRWCDAPGHARHLVLAPTEPPEATLLWDTRQAQPALKLAPDAGDRTLVRKGDASVLGNAMAMKLWLPRGQGNRPPLALVGHENGRVLAWDLAMPVPQVCAKTPRDAFSSPNVALDVNSEGTVLFAGGVEAKARAFRVEPGLLKPHGALEVSCPSIDELDQHQGVGQLALRPDGKVLASAGWDYRVRIFSAKSLKRLAVLRYHDASVNALDWSDDLLATGSKDTKVAVWRLRF